jgi:hypothetical protein
MNIQAVGPTQSPRSADRPAAWDLAQYHAVLAEPPKGSSASRLAESQPLYPAGTDRPALEAMSSFFSRYPSRSAARLVSFARARTLSQSLRGSRAREYQLFHSFQPDAQKPFWASYMLEVERSKGRPQGSDRVERAFLRAHVEDMKAAVKDPVFLKLLSLADGPDRAAIDEYTQEMLTLDRGLESGVPTRKLANTFLTVHINPRTLLALGPRGMRVNPIDVAVMLGQQLRERLP